jgi:O-antigen ligase
MKFRPDQPDRLAEEAPDRNSESVDHAPRRILFIYVMWFFVWFEPDWLVEAIGGGPVLVKLYAAMFIPVGILLVKHFRREALFWPYLVMIGVYAVWIPFVLNRGLLINGFGKVLQYSLLTAVTAVVLETPRQMVPLLKLFLLQFIWFGVQGLPTAGVSWHQNLSNDDSFGPFMTIGLGYAYYVAMGTPIKKYRYLALFVCFLGVAGTIVSFARGAVIGLCMVFVALALRTPRKVAFLGYGTGLAVIALIVIMVMFPNGEFWDEMATITEEGSSGGTGLQRWVMWQAAAELFLVYPILGVGPGNFGPNAAEYFTERGVTDMGSTFDTPQKMYMMTLHNDYVQVMVEQGIVGMIAVTAVFVYFFSFVRTLRTEEVQKVWASHGGGFIDSKNLALGLEAAMIGLMVTSAFYPQIFINYWMWSIMMLAFVAATLSQRLVSDVSDARRAQTWRDADQAEKKVLAK